MRAAGATEVRLAEELGPIDPLVEQLVLALDGLVRDWTPGARTFLDHLTGCLAAHLAAGTAMARPNAPDLRRPCAGWPIASSPRCGS
jgi:AraC family transcriptional regulator